MLGTVKEHWHGSDTLKINEPRRNMTDDLSAETVRTPCRLGTLNGKLQDHGFMQDLPADLGHMPGTDFFHCQHEGLLPYEALWNVLWALVSGVFLCIKESQKQEDGGRIERGLLRV